MFKKILGTAGTKITGAIVSFLIISLNAKLLGAQGIGTIALIILGITIILLFGSLSGGAAMVYLVPRHDVFSLYVPSAIWSALVAVLLAPLFGYFEWIPQEYTLHLLFLSILRSLNANHSAILLGKERIKTNNIISLIEIAGLFIAVNIFYFLLDQKAVLSYLYSMYFSYGLNFLISLVSIRKYLVYKKEYFVKVTSSFRAIFKYSSYNQVGGFFQLMNYRLSYYLIEHFNGLTTLGIYAVGTRLSESIWLISKSMATVQYARIANSKDDAYSNQLTALLFRFILLISSFLTIILLILPTSLYTWIFSDEFKQVKTVLFALAPGIIALACSMALSGHFSGMGKHRLNTIGALIGLVLTAAGGIVLIPLYGLLGAAITASFAYFATTAYYFLHFLRISGMKWKIFLPQLHDFHLLREQLKKITGP